MSTGSGCARSERARRHDLGCNRDRGRACRSHGRSAIVDRRCPRAARREETISSPEGVRRLPEPFCPHRARAGRAGNSGHASSAGASSATFISASTVDRYGWRCRVEAPSREQSSTRRWPRVPSTPDACFSTERSRTSARFPMACAACVSRGTGTGAQASARAVLVASGLGKGVISSAQEPATLVASGSRIGAGCRLTSAPAAYSDNAVFMAIGAGGYVGMVRQEDGSLNVAATFDPALVRRVRTPGAAALEVLEEAGAPVVGGLADAEWRGTAGLTRRTTPLAHDRLFFLGDAAGYVEPFTGEGIAWALASARAVEPLALRAIDRWHPRLAREWARTHRRVIGRRQLVCRALALGLAQPWLVRIGFETLERVPLAASCVMRLLNTPSVFSTASGTCPS